jgi:hypothetical protein
VARAGRDFEKAVYEFCRALDPDAQVLFDHKVRDIDTGEWRQADAWVSYRVMGHFPVSLLISCKDHSRPVGTGVLESLSAEVKSTRAHAGVLYSRSGFTKTASRKGKGPQYFLLPTLRECTARTPDRAPARSVRRGASLHDHDDSGWTRRAATALG